MNHQDTCLKQHDSNGICCEDLICPCDQEEFARLQAENARLREALEWIAADRSLTGETAQGLQRAARDALDGDK